MDHGKHRAGESDPDCEHANRRDREERRVDNRPQAVAQVGTPAVPVVAALAAACGDMPDAGAFVLERRAIAEFAFGLRLRVARGTASGHQIAHARLEMEPQLLVDVVAARHCLVGSGPEWARSTRATAAA